MDPRDRFWRVTAPLGALAVLLTILVVGWSVEPARYQLGYAPEQPIPFSHRVHAGVNRIPCEYCHTNADRSRDATVPPLQTCMNCHQFMKLPDKALQEYIDKAVADRVKSDEPIAWKRVYHMPSYVFFDHRAHVNARVQCQSCHGPVETLDVQTRLMNMRMGRCLACHRDPTPYLPPGSPIKKGPTDCYACHR
ncbi:MAG: cytochrome c3 family protein [Elusimicrobia bacterium]|nr:cytochrome c3 family protein [Elusimicrobiota bacterium]